MSTQSLKTAVFAFGAPLVVVVLLVSNFAAANPSRAGYDNSELATAVRIQKVGYGCVARCGERKIREGAEAYTAQCAACHAGGLVGAPKFSDAAAWGPRIGKGFDALLKSAMGGKGAMGPQAGGALTDLEVARAVVHMANAGGAKFAEPAAK
jgi:cytochrome c5